MLPIIRTGKVHRVRFSARFPLGRLVARLCAGDEEGAALVEFAMIFPVLMILVLGMLSFGIMLNQYLVLTEAVSVGGNLLSVERSNTLDPCADVSTAVKNAAANLNAASLTFTFILNGTSYPGTTCVSTTTNSSGQSTGNLIAGDPVTVKVTYPCSLFVYGNANILPGCTLTAQITEISQ
jgi:Flp pilus assembly protein TadG